MIKDLINNIESEDFSFTKKSKESLIDWPTIRSQLLDTLHNNPWIGMTTQQPVDYNYRENNGMNIIQSHSPIREDWVFPNAPHQIQLSLLINNGRFCYTDNPNHIRMEYVEHLTQRFKTELINLFENEIRRIY